MNEVQISNDVLNQYFIWCHTKTSDDTTGEERIIVLREGTPDGACEHDTNSNEEHRTSTILLRYRIGKEQRESNGQNKPSRRLAQGRDADVKRSSDDEESRTKHRSERSNNSSRQPNNKKNTIFLPDRPLSNISTDILRLSGTRGIPTFSGSFGESEG